MMDTYTERHLDAWLYRAFNEDDRAAAKTAMLTVYAEDPECWGNRGWTEVRAEADARVWRTRQ
jgi:hypothetical protein